MNDPLRQVMVEAPGAGRLDGPSHGGLLATGRGEHPVCGDEVEVDLELLDGRVCAYRWRGAGCPATTAVAAAATRVWGDVAADGEAMEGALRQRLGHLGGLARHEHHAVALLMRAVNTALAGQGAP